MDRGFDDNRVDVVKKDFREQMPATPTFRAARALLGVGAAIVLAVAASGCVGSSPDPVPTPDPFGGLADRANQAYTEGLNAYGQGKYREALDSFDRARLLSPSADERITQMLERTRAALTPTATAVPPTPTEAPTATPVAVATQQADADVAQRYFGQVVLTVLPKTQDASTTTATSATNFFFQDQIALRIDNLKQRSSLPFTLRVFNADTAKLVAEVRAEETSSATPAPRAPATATAAATPKTTDPKLSRFLDTYVWYHQGTEEPGRYHLELYANGTLTNTFDYTVGTEPIPTPTPVVAPTLSLPTVPAADAVPVPPRTVAPPAPTATPAPAAPTTPPVEPTATPQPTTAPTPLPATAGSTQISGVPSGLDVSQPDSRVLVADAAGMLWSGDQTQLSFSPPVKLDRLPIDLGVDQSTGNMFVSTRNQAAVLVLDASGRQLKSIALPGTPGDLEVDSDLGLLYVALPEQQALGIIDIRAGRLLRTVDGMPKVTSLAIDPVRHVLYASHVDGQVTSVDVVSGTVTGRVAATTPGLSGIAASRGIAYAVNPTTSELVAVDPASQSVAHFVLPYQPAAVAASEETGVVYLLTTSPNAVLRLDPSDGHELGRVTLPEVPAGQADKTLRPRMLLNRYNESVYVTLPEGGIVSVVAQDQFPQLTYAVGQPDLRAQAARGN